MYCQINNRKEAEEFLCQEHHEPVKIVLTCYDNSLSFFFERLSQQEKPIIIQEICMDIADNFALQSFDIFKNMPGLTRLNIMGDIKSLEGAEGLTNLKRLSIICNEDDIDLIGIEYIDSLEQLHFRETGIRNLTLINHLPKLKILSIIECDFEPNITFSGLHSLESLIIKYCSDIGRLVFSPSIKLTHLDFCGTIPTEIVNLNLVNLIRCFCTSAGLKDLTFLQGAERIKDLIACDNPFEDLAQLSELETADHICVSKSIKNRHKVCKTMVKNTNNYDNCEDCMEHYYNEEYYDNYGE
jgi:hypothetical protein